MNLRRSGYYAWVKAGCPKLDNKDLVLLAHIRQVERENGHNYGVQKVYEELNDQGIRVGRSRVQRVTHQNGIKAQIKSKYKPQTTKADLNEKAYENMLNQHFSGHQPNCVWLADITYIRVGSKWSYLAGVINLGRRKSVGWALGTHPTAKLACQSLAMAICKEKPKPGLIHHSDR